MKRTRLKTQTKRIKGLKVNTWRDIIVISFVVTIVTAVGMDRKPDVKIISPIPVKAFAEAIPTPTPVIEIKTTEQQQIAEHIKEVFGEDADKAFKVLSCENKALRPDAVNTTGNSPAGSRDIGVFQINEYWQKVNGRFLFNPKVNVEIAYQIFKESGNSFKMWSCGKRFEV